MSYVWPSWGEDSGGDVTAPAAYTGGDVTVTPDPIPDNPGGPMDYYGQTLSEIGESVSSLNFGPSMTKWVQDDPVFQRITAENLKTLEQRGGAKETSLLGKVEGFAQKNKFLTELTLRGVGGALASRSQAKAQAKGRENELRAANELKQADNARISASVTGLRKPGLIGKQMPLRRIDGTPVFNNGRL